MQVDDSTGTIPSGDVELFYRRFGKPGGIPLLIIHGANYFDSADWIEVAASLAQDREVVAFDQRGFGQSGWSPTKNYSNDAQIGDMLALLDHLGWQRAALLGHSRGGIHAILFAARHPERTAALILADSSPDGVPPAPKVMNVGNQPRVFPTLDALQSALSRDPAMPGSPAFARLQEFTKEVEGGFIVGARDPDFGNIIPIDTPDWSSAYTVEDYWAELKKVQAPVCIIHGSRSDRFPQASLERFQKNLSYIPIHEIPSGHDLASGAPHALIGVISRFIQRLDNAG